MSSIRVYGSNYNPLTGASDGQFPATREETAGWTASSTDVITDMQAQSDTISIGSNGTYNLTCSIEDVDDFIPDDATNISVVVSCSMRTEVLVGTIAISARVKRTSGSQSNYDPVGPTATDGFHEFAARTTDEGGTVALTGTSLKSLNWGISVAYAGGIGQNTIIHGFAIQVTYDTPAVVVGDPLEDSEIPGTTARLNVARLGAARLGAAIDSPNLQDGANGIYDYTRAVPQNGPPGAATNSWTEKIDPEDV